MKKYILIIGLFVTSLAFSQGGYTKPVVIAINVTIADAGAIITATEVENALQENRIAINLNTSKPTGSGTTNTIPKFTSANSLGDSNITDDGSTVSTTLPIDVNGKIQIGSGAFFNRINAIGSETNLLINSNSGNLFLNEDVADDIHFNGGGGNAIFSGNVTADSFIKNGGLSTEFLKADGSVSTGIAKSDLVVALKTKVSLGDVSGTVDIDTSLGIHFTMNMTGNITSLTFSNLTNEELKTISLEITGDAGGYTIAQPGTVKPDNVWSSLDSTLKNQIQIYMFDISTPEFSTTLLKW